MMIKCERISLEPLAVKHYSTAYEYSTDIENTRMMCFMPCDDGSEVMDYLSKCEKQWNSDKPEYLDAAVMLDDKHIGAVSVEFLENGTVGEFGWIIHKNYWGNGYAVEAVRHFMKYCTEKYGLKKYIAHADSENTASKRVMEKLGMSLVSISTGRKNRNSDELRNECLYEIIAQDKKHGRV